MRSPAPWTQLGIPVYLSGMARGLLGREHPLQMRHARRGALRESDCVLLAGVPCDFRLDYGRHVRRAATLIAANRSAKDARLNRRPTIAAIGDAGATLRSLAQRIPEGVARPDWVGQLRARDDAREVEIDAQARAGGERVNPVAFFRMLEHAIGEEAGDGRRRRPFRPRRSRVEHPAAPPRGPLSWLDPARSARWASARASRWAPASCVRAPRSG